MRCMSRSRTTSSQKPSAFSRESAPRPSRCSKGARSSRASRTAAERCRESSRRSKQPASRSHRCRCRGRRSTMSICTSPAANSRRRTAAHEDTASMKTLSDTWFMVVRQARNLMREPIWIALILIQPMVWLILYGQLFKNVTKLGGFGTASYITFLAPAIVVMNAFFGATWSGMSMIADLDHKVIERFLATPASRFSLVLSQIVRSALTAAIQAVVILLVSFALGVRVHTVAKFNPVDWGVRAARGVVLPGTSWSSVAGYLLLLLGLSAVTASCATWTFRSYQ